MKSLFVATLAVFSTTCCLQAQKVIEKKPKEVKVQVIEETNGQTTTTTRTYNSDDLKNMNSNNDVQVFVDSSKDGKNKNVRVMVRKGGQTSMNANQNVQVMVDSIMEGGKKKMRVVVNSMDTALNFNYGDMDERVMRSPKTARKQGRSRTMVWSDGNGRSRTYNFDVPEWDSARFRTNMRRLNDNIDRSLNEAFDAIHSPKPSSIQGLYSSPNYPDKNEIDVRFAAPNKGDVLISVANTKGKVVATKEIKDFSGEYRGHIDLGKDAKGTYFLTVTQNEDGATKRIVID